MTPILSPVFFFLAVSTVVAQPPIDRSYSPLPQPVSSFGAVACDGWLYVYGGHTVKTHAYSNQSVSGQFHRLNLSDHKTWEALPGGPPLQGLNLAAWHGKIYRVGGMKPTNKKGQTESLQSVADCACYDPAKRSWSDLPPLPKPRSSHDIVVAGNKLIVVGGWNLSGDSDDAVWMDTTLILDLSAANPKWATVKQPFQRRALIAAVYEDMVYVIGGFTAEAEASREVDLYDPVMNKWSKGPRLPAPDDNGFGPAACVLNSKLYVSVADGSLYRLNAAGSGWDKVAATTPRIVHRLALNGSQLLIIGGASGKKQLDLIEAVAPN
jgi:N-acetylneuraminic acid mutarotase